MKHAFALIATNKRVFGPLLTILGIFLLCIPVVSFAEAILYISPEKGTYTLGQTFEVKVYADTGDKPINAAEGDIAFNNDALQVVRLSQEGSILTSWSTAPQFSNDDGTIRFAGWMKKNYAGPNGLLITITFKAVRNMVGNARLAAGAILAADGVETNIITSMRSGVFTIAPQEQPADTSAAQSNSGVAGSASSTEEIAASTAKVPAPAFDNVPDSVAIGDRIVVRGNAEPNAHIHIFLSRGSETEKDTEVMSAADGSFTYVSEEPVVEGVYHVRASTITSDGRQSVQSDSYDINAAHAGVAATAIFGASLLFETIPFFAILILGGLGAAYLYHRHQVAKMHYGQHSMFDQE